MKDMDNCMQGSCGINKSFFLVYSLMFFNNMQYDVIFHFCFILKITIESIPTAFTLQG